MPGFSGKLLKDGHLLCPVTGTYQACIDDTWDGGIAVPSGAAVDPGVEFELVLDNGRRGKITVEPPDDSKKRVLSWGGS